MNDAGVNEAGTGDPAGLLAQARAWRDDDPDPRTRDELAALLRAGDLDGLEDRFSGLLRFGTAGLRGALGAGPNRMNRAVVIRAAAGLAGFLADRVPAPTVVIGFDARHGSATFARDTAAVLVAAGAEVLLIPRPLPTPVLAFAVRHLDADAGVMVTASHNPAADNGYKVYLGGRIDPDSPGAQLNAPHDAEIAERMAAVPSVRAVPRAGSGWRLLDDDLHRRYRDAAVGVLSPRSPRELRVVYTPLHGVGADTVVAALTAAGFPAPHVVPEQARPDPEFPTLPFPNPEEPGALDLALAAAREHRADLVIANDPDADRCALAVPDGGIPGGRGGWRVLHGDEVGCLLAEHLLARAPRPRPVVASSIVSSELLGRIAAAHGARHVETLTGFKWLARVPNLDYGYEEALGYCAAPGLVLDKDGVTAALLLAELVAALRAAGRTVTDALDDLARAHGVHLTGQLSLRLTGTSAVPARMHRLRAAPPATLGGAPVTAADDLRDGADGLPPADVLRYRTAGGLRVIVRPSGTEPKLKCYLEAVRPVPDGDVAAARAAARDALAAARDDLARLLG